MSCSFSDSYSKTRELKPETNPNTNTNTTPSRLMNLTNRVALITGGKRLGGEIALALATRGADIALCYRASRAEAEATADAVVGLGRRAHLVQGDLYESG